MKRRLKQAAKRLWKDIWEYKVIGIAILIYYVLVSCIFSAFCPSVIITGFPCPGCGMTRGFLFVMSGQFERAWNINPLIYGWILLALYVGVQRYFLGRKVRGFKQLIALLAIAMIIVFIYRMYRYFPNQPPMTFTGGSMFEKILPEYGRVIRELLY